MNQNSHKDYRFKKLFCLFIAAVCLMLMIGCGHERTSYDSNETLLIISPPKLKSVGSRAINQESVAQAIPELTSLSIELKDSNGDVLKVGELLNTTQAITISVAPGKALSLSGSGYASSEKIYDGLVNIEPLSAGETRAIAITLKPTVTLDLTLPAIISKPEGGGTLVIGESQELAIGSSLQGLNNTSIIWSVNNVKGGNDVVGTIDDNGTYKPPAVLPENAQVVIKAAPNAAPSFSVEVTVDLTVGESGINSIEFRDANAGMTIGQEQQLILDAFYSDDDSELIAADQITWSVSNDAVLSVNEAGLVTALSAGTVEVTSTALGLSTTLTITVSPASTEVILSEIQLNNPPESLDVDDVGQFQLAAVYSDSSRDDIPGDQITNWQSSDTTVLSVSAMGEFVALSAGTALITIEALGKQTSMTLTVNEPPIDTDGDGLSDDDEIVIHLTSPTNPDSDNDTYYDAHEIAAGTNPNNATSVPAGTVIEGNTNIFANADNVRWTLADAPIILKRSFSIPDNFSLTIEAGVVIKLDASRSISVAQNGRLSVLGKSGIREKVLFTSIKDDSINGDSNADGTDTSPAPGDWGFIRFNDGSTGNVKNAGFRYGDSSNGYGVLSFAGSDVEVTDVVINSFARTAININNASPSLSNISVRSENISYAAIVVSGESANPSLTNITTDGGRYGLELNNKARGVYQGLSLSDTNLAAVYLTGDSAPTSFDSVTVNNSPEPLIVFSQTLPASIDFANDFTISDQVAPVTYLKFSGNLNKSYTLTPDPLNTGSSVWLLNAVSIQSQAELSVEAGTVIKFEPSGYLYVYNGGKLSVLGNEAEPVILTGFKDDTAGGDSNGDGEQSTAQPGDWNYVWFDKGSVGNINFAELNYAGSSGRGALSILSDDVLVSNLKINQNVYQTIRIIDSSPNLANVTINSSITNYETILVSGENANPLLQNVSSTGGKYGLSLNDKAKGQYQGLTLSGATTAAVYLTGDSAPTSFTDVSVNASPEPLILYSQTLPASIDFANDISVTDQVGPVTYVKLSGSFSQPYTLSPDPLNNGNSVWLLSNLSVVNNGHLTIEAGTIVKFEAGGYIYVYSGGELSLSGSEPEPIILTSFKDDTAGGDSNRDESVSTAQPGDWNYVWFDTGTTGTINYSEMRYTGGNSYGALSLNTSNVTISHLTIDQNAYQAIGIINSSPVLSDIAITGVNANYDAITVRGENANPSLNNITATGGRYGLSLSDKANGLYQGLTFSSADKAAVYLTGDSSPTSFTGISVSSSPEPIILFSQTLPASIDFSNDVTVTDQATPVTYIKLSGGLYSDYTLSPDPLNNGNSVWLLNTLSIFDQGYLTIEAGTIVKFEENGYLYVYNGGRLTTVGNQSEPVILTSFKDDTAGGDSNVDGAVSTAKPGDWNYVWFGNGSVGELDFTELRFARGSNAAMGIESSDVTVSNLVIDQNERNAIQINNVSPTLSNVTLTSVATNYDAISVSGESADPNLSNVTVTGGRYGLSLSNKANGLYQDITFTNATTAAIYLTGDSIPTSFNGISVANTPEPIVLYSQTLPASINFVNDVTVTDQTTPVTYVKLSGSFNQPYTLSPDPLNNGSSVWLLTNLTIQSGGDLTIDAGTVVKFESSGYFNVNNGGNLSVVGSQAEPVIFTSFKDDSAGGDSNQDGETSPAQPGDWLYLQFNNGSTGNLNHMELRYARGSNAALLLSSSDVIVSNLLIDQTQWNAISISNVSPILSNVIVTSIASNYDAISVSGDNADPNLSNITVTGGRYGLSLNNLANGSYQDLTFINASSAVIYLSGDSAPTSFENIKVSNIPENYVLFNQTLPDTIVDGDFVPFTP